MKKLKSNLIVIAFFSLTFFFLVLRIFPVNFSCMDEIWNFQNIYKMYHNGLIYKDNNVIVTPIFFIIGNFLFHLFHANLTVFRFYNVGIYLIKFVLIYLIFRSYRIKRFLAFLYTSIWLIIDFPYISSGANYNQLAIIFCLIGTLWHISSHSKNNYHFIQGLILFFVFFTKQTIGVYYGLGLFLFEIIEIGLNQDFFKNQLQKLFTFLSCTFLFLLVFFLRGNLGNFINLCFGSILEFARSNFYFSWDTFEYIIAIAFIITFSIFGINSEKISAITQKNAKFLLCLSIGMLFNILPLMNSYHINLSILFFYLLFIYIVNELLISEIFCTRFHEHLSTVIYIGIFLALFIKIGSFYFRDFTTFEHFDKSHPFYNIPISTENIEKINNMTQYIKSKNSEGIQVLVLSYEASMYMIPLSINNGEFDLLFRGNLGYHGIENIIQKIEHMKNTEFLIFTNAENCFFQESQDIRDYILENFEKKDEILEYSIYINE